MRYNYWCLLGQKWFAGMWSALVHMIGTVDSRHIFSDVQSLLRWNGWRSACICLQGAKSRHEELPDNTAVDGDIARALKACLSNFLKQQGKRINLA